MTYKVREPSLRAAAATEQQSTYTDIGTKLFETNCASCHGKGAAGGNAPALAAKEFLKSTSDGQIQGMIAGGISGTEMSPWSLAYGGTLTDEQVRQLTTYLRSLEPTAQSVPNWRKGTNTK